MKLNGRSLKRRLYGLKTLPSRVARARYFRGHGVHSPFVYAIVRQVFMKRELRDGDRSLYERLTAAGFPYRRAVQLQNLAIHCGYAVCEIDRLPEPCNFCLLTPAVDDDATCDIVVRAAKQGTTIALTVPYQGRERAELCRRLIEAHRGTTVDNRAYLLIFNNRLPKQHFRL